MKIKGKLRKGYDLEIKRFYVPGIKLVGKCPECGSAYEQDFEDDYLSNPSFGKPTTIYCFCDECDHEWQTKVQIDMTMKYIGE